MPETDILNAYTIQYYPELVSPRFPQFVHTVFCVRKGFSDKILIKQLSNYFYKTQMFGKLVLSCLLFYCFYTLPFNVASV